MLKIIPERVTVVANAQGTELTVIMDGFRLTLDAEDARTLGDALMRGAKQLPGGARPFMKAASPSLLPKTSTTPSAQDVASSKSTEAGTEAIRSLSA